MSDTSLPRRSLLAASSLASLSLLGGCASSATGHAQTAANLSPWDWTDQNGLVRDLPKDKDPLTRELEKHPRCRYCGMERAKFSHTRHLLVYEDDSVDGTCSLYCAGISLSLNMDLGPKAIYAGDAGADGKIKPLVLVDKAYYVLDPSKPGTMTKASKFAYADKLKAEAAVAASAKAGAKMVNFDAALTAAYLGMAEDTVMLRKRRGEMRRKAKMG